MLCGCRVAPSKVKESFSSARIENACDGRSTSGATSIRHFLVRVRPKAQQARPSYTRPWNVGTRTGGLKRKMSHVFHPTAEHNSCVSYSNDLRLQIDRLWSPSWDIAPCQELRSSETCSNLDVSFSEASLRSQVRCDAARMDLEIGILSSNLAVCSMCRLRRIERPRVQ